MAAASDIKGVIKMEILPFIKPEKMKEVIMLMFIFHKINVTAKINPSLGFTALEFLTFKIKDLPTAKHEITSCRSISVVLS